MTNRSLKVLIIDDDKFLLNMYALKFKKSGLEVNVATGGNEAMRIIKDGFMPDIILLDIVMPVMDGLELLKNIKEQKLAPNAVIIMLTNQGQPTDIKKAQDLGIEGYIVKATTIPSEVLDEALKIYKANRG
ncbi:MAG: response regulator [Candidatus Paceibacterota bacterium]|jgi:CheY-like chemotaxis protein